MRGGRICFVGSETGARSAAGSGASVHDFGSATVLPGLRDAHAHLVQTGLARRRIDLEGLSLAEVREAVAERARGTEPGGWVGGAGFSLDRLGTDRPPTAADLDDVAPRHPVRLASHDLHALWVNTSALEAAGRPPTSPSYLTEDEIRLFLDATGREGSEELRSACREAQGAFHAHGITAVQEHGRMAELSALEALAGRGQLELRVDFSVRDHEFAGYLETTDEHPALPGLLTVNGQKTFLDGALGSRTAWLLEPYEGTGETGHRARDPREVRESVARAAAAGYPTFFHAIGDAAVREALDVAATAPGLPHRVEHAQLVHEDDLPRFAAQGVAASMQPVHLLTDTPAIRERWGEQRARRSFPVRSLLRSGARVLLGSDSPVETPDPMRGVFAATTRSTLDGLRLPGDETIPVGQALYLYLSTPKLEPGRPADLSIWPEDPARLPLEEIPRLEPLATIFAGRVVHLR